MSVVDHNNPANVLYISYNGLMEPLGQSQVLQYLKELSLNNNIYLITYEKTKDLNDVLKINKFKSEVSVAGICWIALRYHNRFGAIATMYDIIRGLLIAVYIVIHHKIQIVHARSYIASIIALVLKWFLGVKFIFDMRGFWPDERVNSGQWSECSLMYKIFKRLERLFLLSADSIVSLTHAGVCAINQFDYVNGRNLNFKVIPTCVNLDKFKCKYDEKQIGKKPFILGCVGSVRGWFLFDAVVLIFKALLELVPDSKLVVISRDDPSYIYSIASEYKVPGELIIVKEVDFNDVPKEIILMDAGVFFYKSSFSELARSPTKMAEFLACGVPCLSNSGIGDVTDIINKEGVGVVIDDFTPSVVAESVKRLVITAYDPNIKLRCLEVANKYYSLVHGVSSYNKLYQSLLRD